MQPFLQTIGEYWQALGTFFAFDAALLAEPSMVLRLALLAVLFFCSAFFYITAIAIYVANAIFHISGNRIAR